MVTRWNWIGQVGLGLARFCLAGLIDLIILINDPLHQDYRVAQ